MRRQPAARHKEGRSPSRFQWVVLDTAFGFIQVIESTRGLVAVRLGSPDAFDVPGDVAIEEVSRSAIADKIDAYTRGRRVPLLDISLDVPTPFSGPWTPFRDRVTRACRAIPHGEVRTYADLARQARLPKASRAVGGVMARNPFPLVVPCHRVVRTGGGLGGFSAPLGLTLKQQLLELEGAMSAVQGR